ncbi:unnamed protein product [Malus baccata var. baccata]
MPCLEQTPTKEATLFNHVDIKPVLIGLGVTVKIGILEDLEPANIVLIRTLFQFVFQELDR